MKTFKTKTPFTFEVPDTRGQYLTKIIFLKVESLFQDKNNLIAKGYYYHEVEQLLDGEPIQVPIFMDTMGKNDSGTIVSKSDLRFLEENQQVENFNPQFYEEATLQRIVELTFIQLEKEAGENWGTVRSDWEEVIE